MAGTDINEHHTQSNEKINNSSTDDNGLGLEFFVVSSNSKKETGSNKKEGPLSNSDNHINEDDRNVEKFRSRCPSEYNECAAVGQWEFALGIGVGLRTNPLFEQDNTPLILLPSVSYYGERFFLDNLRVGFTLFDNSHTSKTNRSHMLNVVGTISLEQIFFDDSLIGNLFLSENSTVGLGPVDNAAPPLNPVDPVPESTPEPVEPTEQRLSLENARERRTAVLTGFEYQYNIGNFSLSAQLLNDVSKVHSGYEFRWGVSQPFSLGKSDFGLALGGLWQDKKLLDYYYGVSFDDTSNSAFFYTVDGGSWSPFVRFDWRYQINRHWSLVSQLQVKALADQIKDSPLVEDGEVITGFIGGVYRF